MIECTLGLAILSASFVSVDGREAGVFQQQSVINLGGRPTLIKYDPKQIVRIVDGKTTFKDLDGVTYDMQLKVLTNLSTLPHLKDLSA